jgi:hypothetical protein
MKHFSGIDYDHFLDDIRDMYPFSIEEAVLVELIANALDAKTTLIDIRIDPERNILELTDNGVGMDKRGFEMYHNFSSSFKRKGQGIGFAGLGAKLALKISDRIITETRQKDGGQSRGKNFWGTSEWKFEHKGKTSIPVWYDLEARSLANHGTRVAIHFKRKPAVISKSEETKAIVLRHYLPLLALSEFYDTLRLYRRITVLVNGEVLEPPKPAAVIQENIRHYLLKRGSTRRPFALAHFEMHPASLPEDMQGIAIATYGKIVRREYFKQHFPGMERITGIIEVPELVECLTTNKCDFRKDGALGNKYYRFTKIAQREFRRWLEEIHLMDRTEARADKDTQRLQRMVNRIVGEIPDLQQFYGSRGDRATLVKDPEGNLTGALPEPSPHASQEQADTGEQEQLIRNALSEAQKVDRILEEGGDFAALRRPRAGRFGPVIRYVASPEREDISWMEGDSVLINTDHPTYRKAVEKKIVEYHDLFAVALAMLREVPTASEKLELLERFMSRWGKM